MGKRRTQTKKHGCVPFYDPFGCTELAAIKSCAGYYAFLASGVQARRFSLEDVIRVRIRTYFPKATDVRIKAIKYFLRFQYGIFVHRVLCKRRNAICAAYFYRFAADRYWQLDQWQFDQCEAAVQQTSIKAVWLVDPIGAGIPAQLPANSWSCKTFGH